ncbi:unnamed protein product [Rhizophagus irregularis]|nr:unnamed protein product [Rhizophagus irregularis]CAB5344558.1 unnamed protein product [Rhizophagus irregularis]
MSATTIWMVEVGSPSGRQPQDDSTRTYDFVALQDSILLSGEMEEVEVAGPEQASVTIGLLEADSGSSPKRGIVGDANVTGGTYGDFELEI